MIFSKNMENKVLKTNIIITSYNLIISPSCEDIIEDYEIIIISNL